LLLGLDLALLFALEISSWLSLSALVSLNLLVVVYNRISFIEVKPGHLDIFVRDCGTADKVGVSLSLALAHVHACYSELTHVRCSLAYQMQILDALSRHPQLIQILLCLAHY
jgi:hypothetical protein